MYIFAALGAIHDCYIFEYDACSKHLELLGSGLGNDTVVGLQYIADDVEYDILRVNAGTNSDGAPNEGIVDH